MCWFIHSAGTYLLIPLKRLFVFFTVIMFGTNLLQGQGLSTAKRPLDLSLFGGFTTATSELSGEASPGISAGVDLGFHTVMGIAPAFEIRGRASVSSGDFVGEKAIAGGLRAAVPNGKVRPFITVLVGRKQFEYPNDGYYAPGTNRFYLHSASYQLAPGAGLLVDVNSFLSLRADVQVEFAHSPVTVSGNVTSLPVTLAIVWAFPSTRHGHPFP